MFIGMWNFADDTGRLPHSAKAIKAKIFPSDDLSLDDIRGMLRELSSNGLIVVYAVENEEYLQITGWQHQRIDKPQPSKYPAPFFDDSGKAIGTLPPDRKGEDKKGEERKEKISRAASPSNEDFETLKKAYPKRAGNYGWKAAERKFNALVKTGVDPKAIIAAAVRLRETLRSKIGTEFIPMPASWLNSEDFVECAVVAFDGPQETNWDAICATYKKLGIWSKHAPGNGPDSPSCLCPPEILEKHGIAVPLPDNPAYVPNLRAM
jgi:hypothetical protein